jgi:hypothetical protein
MHAHKYFQRWYCILTSYDVIVIKLKICFHIFILTYPFFSVNFGNLESAVCKNGGHSYILLSVLKR